jgi:hypothetical protein
MVDLVVPSRFLWITSSAIERPRCDLGRLVIHLKEDWPNRTRVDGPVRPLDAQTFLPG